MNLGMVLILAYWAVFTVRKGFSPKVLLRAKAARYDLNNGNEREKKTAQRLTLPLFVATWALRVGGWVENILLVLVGVWLVFLVGAIITGGFVIFGYPV